MRWLAQELTNARKEHAAAIVAHAAKHDDLDVKLNAAQKAHEQACTLRQFRHIAAQPCTVRMALSQAQARLNALTTENAVMSAQLSSSTADVARLTTSNDKWQQMCDGRARG